LTEEGGGTAELYGKCMSLAEDYLNQYMLNGTIDMQKVVYDYANRTPCTFKKSSKRCCIAVRNLSEGTIHSDNI